MDADAKLLPAKSLTISVRCYESRVGRVNTLQSNVLVDYTQVLWSKPDDVDCEPIGSLDYSFRITVPVKAAGFSTAVFVDYRCLWRIEAVLTHAPIAGVGSRQIKHFELPLIRYDLPIYRPISYGQVLNEITSKPRAPRIRYSLNPPTSPIGPLDLVSIPIHLQPLDNDVSIRSASIIIERRIQLNDIANSSSPLQPELPSSSPLPVVQPPSPLLSSPTHSDFATDGSYINSEGLVSSSSLSSSDPTITPNTIFPSSSISVATATSTTPLLPPTPTTPPAVPSSPGPSKTVVNPIAGTESSGHFARDNNGVWCKTLTLQWPAVKSHSRWAIGETIQSELVSVQYFVRTKIIVTSPAGTESIDLAERELLIVSTNDAERQLALAKYNERHDQIVDKTLRSKSKSPRRMRPHRDDPTPPTQVPPLPSTSAGFQLPKPKSISSRRPHTSAGPRDKSFHLGVGSFGRSRSRGQEPDSSSGHMDSSPDGGSSSRSSISNHEGANGIYCKRRVESNARQPESSPSEVKQTRSAGMLTSGFWSTTSSHAPRLTSTPSGSSTSTTASSSSLSSSSVGGDSDLSDHMREWEEELARIEMKSRWSSDMLGFFGKRKRSAASVPKVVIPSDEDYAHS